MSTLKIIVEVFLAIFSLSLGGAFWSFVKSPKFLGRTLADISELRKYILFIGKDNIIKESRQLGSPPDGFDRSDLIVLLITSSIKATDKTKYVAITIFILVLIGSYFLNPIFPIINLIIFLLIRFRKITSAAKNNVFNDINSIAVNIYRWNQDDAENCEQFCLVKRPRFATIYKLITTEI